MAAGIAAIAANNEVRSILAVINPTINERLRIR